MRGEEGEAERECGVSAGPRVESYQEGVPGGALSRASVHYPDETVAPGNARGGEGRRRDGQSVEGKGTMGEGGEERKWRGKPCVFGPLLLSFPPTPFP